MSMHVVVVDVVERGDESGAVRELVDKHGIPIAVADEVSLDVTQQQAHPAHFGCGDAERFGVATVRN